MSLLATLFNCELQQLRQLLICAVDSFSSRQKYVTTNSTEITYTVETGFA